MSRAKVKKSGKRNRKILIKKINCIVFVRSASGFVIPL
jgi:hypothetical protein